VGRRVVVPVWCGPVVAGVGRSRWTARWVGHDARVSLDVATGRATTDAPDRATLRSELLLVLALSLGASGVYAVLDLLRDLTTRVALADQTSTVVGSRASNSYVDLGFQVAEVCLGVVPVLLVAHLLRRSGESLGTLGVDGSEPRRDLGRGTAIAAVIGGCGLALYLGAHALGINTTVAVTTLPPSWWRDPLLALHATQDALVEEVVVLGYTLRRLDQLGWRPGRALAASALLRGSYHLYQGFGGFVGNAIMGVVFGLLLRRWKRVAPFVVAHSLIDIVAFVGYAELHGHVSWLP